MYVDKYIKIFVDNYKKIVITEISQVIHNLKTLQKIDKFIDSKN
jgi:hypothetical protein